MDECSRRARLGPLGEAERLEHFISERFEERIAARLVPPQFDPHGHCIPALDRKMRAIGALGRENLDRRKPRR